MVGVEVLRQQSQLAFAELLGSIDGVSEQLAWAVMPLQPGEYMHTEGSILSNVVHVASCEVMYGSAAYRNLEVRWRDVVERVDAFWPSWEVAKAYLQEAHDYWLSTWADETGLDRLVKTNWGAEWPSWKVISTVIHHDSYHAGQIQLLRCTLNPSTTPPPAETHLWREFISDYSW